MKSTPQIDYSKLSFAALEKHQAEIAAALQMRQAEFARDFVATAARHNLTLEAISQLVKQTKAVAKTAAPQLTPANGNGHAPAKTVKRSKGKGSKVSIKYRNPLKPSEGWTGRGMMPRWLASAVKSGAKREDFLIDAAR